MCIRDRIRGYSTSDSTYDTIKELTNKLEKEPVEVFDYPGFISNRILMPMINESIFALMEGVASKESIDSVMKLGMAHPMGPLTLADFIGLDVCLAIMNVLYEGFNDPKYRPCPLLKKMVAANKLGRKTGEGFYTVSYTNLRAHETVLDLVCRLLLEKKTKTKTYISCLLQLLIRYLVW